jgi:hypothetical protein
VKRRITISVLILSFVLAAAYQSGISANEGWERVSEGIEYQEFRLPGPNRVFVARMDRANPNVILETSIAQGKLSGGRETVSDMALRYDQAINTWDTSRMDIGQRLGPIIDTNSNSNHGRSQWGARNNVIVAINGSFFDFGTGIARGGMMHSGWYVKPFGELAGYSGFAWKRIGSSFIGECIHHRPDKQILTNLTRNQTMQIDGINFPRRAQHLIIYTPQFDRRSYVEYNSVEALVEITEPVGIKPLPAMILGIVREVDDEPNAFTIPFDHIVLSARGPAREPFLDMMHAGDVVGISLELTSFAEDCETLLPHDWTKAYASLGGSFFFLQDGEIVYFDDNLGATQRHPRTAICYNDAYIHFVVVDGRRNGYSRGMSIPELANFCKGTLHTDWGINQDGGGSSTMWVNGEVKNLPSDGNERLVANGMMMVIVEPMERSSTFQVGDQVRTHRSVPIRLGPGTNYSTIKHLEENVDGRIIPHLNHLNGVMAKGTYWWRVEIGGRVGWVNERALSRANTPPIYIASQIMKHSMFVP